MKYFFFILFFIILTGCQHENKNMKDDMLWFEQGLQTYVQKVPVFNNAKNIHSLAPEVLFGYAKYLFENNEKEKSVFVFYVAQLRARILLQARTSITPISKEYYEESKKQAGLLILGQQIYLSSMTREELYFMDILEGLGSVINGWAGTEPDLWVKQMTAALEYENNHPFIAQDVLPAEKITDPKIVKKISQEQKEGLNSLIQMVESEILKKREKNF